MTLWRFRRWARFWKKISIGGLSLSLISALLVIIPVQVSLAPDAEAADCSATASNNLTATAAHGKVFYIDSGVTPKVDAAYVGYKINNTAGSGTRSGLWVSLETFTGGKVGLANPSDAYQQLPDISFGSYKTAFFLLKASGPTTFGQTHTVKIYDKRPDLSGATALLTCTFSFTAVKETIKANANKVTTVTSSLSPATPTLGGTLTISVTDASTGKVGQGSSPDNSLFWVSPAAVSTWPTRSLRLESTTINLGCTGGSTAGNTTVTITNTLSYSNAQTACFNNASGTWTASYVFRIIGPGPASLTPTPVAIISSGTQYKHSDIAGLSFGTAVNLSGVASSAFTVTVTASSQVIEAAANSARIRYTVSLTTTSSTAVSIDEIIDRRANGTAIVSGSVKYDNVARGDPVIVSSEANLVPPPYHHIGPFSVSSAATSTLVYDLTVPCAVGSTSYSNVVYALVGDQILGASTTTLSSAVVTTITSGVSCDVTTTTTTETINPTGQTYPATNVASDNATATSTATLNGFANAYGLANVTAAFRYSKDSNLASNTTLTSQQNVTGSAPVALSANISSLDPGTVYYFRIEVGTVKGAILNFTTPAILALPTVTTGAVSGITGTGNNIDVTLNGLVNPNLNTLTPITFEYCLYNASTCNGSSMPASPTVITAKMDNGAGTATNLSLSGSGDFPVDTNNIDGTQQITGLDSGNTYYYRAVATCSSTVTAFCPNTSTKFTGTIRQFTLGVILVTTTEATAVADTTATLNGTANGNSVNNQSAKFIYCASGAGCSASSLSGTTSSPNPATSIASNYNSTISTNLTGLTPNTTYFYQAVGLSGGVEKTYGEILSFKTISITTTSLPGGTKDVSYQSSVAGSGGTGSYSFAVTSGSLPAGTSMSTAGLISGTPSASGTSNFTVTLTELFYNTTTTRSLSITVIEVVTSAASSITATSAVLNGSASINLTSPKFCYSTSNPNGSFDASTCTALTESGNSPYSETLNGLSASTTYYFQLTGTDGTNTYYGSVLSFKTNPTLTSAAATNITATSATIRATASEELTDPRLCFSATNPAGNFDWSSADCSSGTTAGTFNTFYTEAIASLTASTTYHYQLTGKVSGVVYYSDKTSFKTLPTLSAAAAQDITATSATIRGTATESLTDPRLCFSATNPVGNFTWANAECSSGTTSGAHNTAYTEALTSLSPSTTYYFQLSGVVSGATYYSDKLSFKTLPTVTTAAANSIGETTATIGGTATEALTNPKLCFSASNPNGDFNYADCVGGTVGGTFTGYTRALTGLTASTTYYFQLLGQVSSSTYSGNVLTFTTSAAGATYTVTYNGNGNTAGNAPSSTSQASAGAAITLALQGTLAKDGYTFAGWNELSDGTGTNRDANTGYTPTGNITLYAKWTINQYTISYSGNGSDGGSTPASVTQNYNTTFTVAANTFTRAGYTFSNWNAQSNGGGASYTANSSTYTIGASNATLFAIWTINTYTVTYNGNGSDGGSVPVDGNSPYNFNASITVLGNSGNLTKSGFTFSGWNTLANGEGIARAANSTFSMGSSNVTLYAVWSANANSGSGGSPSAPVIPGPKITQISKSLICSIGNEVVINGSFFEGGSVTLDGVAAAIRIISATSITVMLPQAVAGKRTIKVTTPHGSDIAFIEYVTVPRPKFESIRMPYLSQGSALFLPIFALNASSYSLNGRLPAGLTLNVDTGVISGTPSENGIFIFNLIASGICGETLQYVELDIDAPTPNAISHRINFLPNSCEIPYAAKASLEKFLEKAKAMSPRNIIPEIYVSGGSKNGDPNSQAAKCRQEAICDFLLLENLLGEVLTDVFTGSENRIEIIVYWPRPNDE